jgi:adenine phosphoribosyltransferase
MSGDTTQRALRARVREAFAWRGDRTDDHRYADVTGWWRQPDLLRELGPALAGLFDRDRPTVVLGPESRGCLLGPLVALSLGVGFVEVRKDRVPAADSDAWLRRTTPPDYRDRHLSLGFRKSLLDGSDTVLLVDDWIDTGGQAMGAQLLTQHAGATWLGVATVVDALRANDVRRRLNVRSLLHVRDL